MSQVVVIFAMGLFSKKNVEPAAPGSPELNPVTPARGSRGSAPGIRRVVIEEPSSSSTDGSTSSPSKPVGVGFMSPLTDAEESTDKDTRTSKGIVKWFRSKTRETTCLLEDENPVDMASILASSKSIEVRNCPPGPKPSDINKAEKLTTSAPEKMVLKRAKTAKESRSPSLVGNNNPEEFFKAPASPTTNSATTVIPTKSVDPATTVIPTKSVDPATTIIPTKSVDPATTIIPTKSVDPATTIIPTKSVDPATTIIPTKSVDPATTIMPTKSVAPQDNAANAVSTATVANNNSANTVRIAGPTDTKPKTVIAPITTIQPTSKTIPVVSAAPAQPGRSPDGKSTAGKIQSGTTVDAKSPAAVNNVSSAPSNIIPVVVKPKATIVAPRSIITVQPTAKITPSAPPQPDIKQPPAKPQEGTTADAKSSAAVAKEPVKSELTTPAPAPLRSLMTTTTVTASTNKTISKATPASTTTPVSSSSMGAAGSAASVLIAATAAANLPGQSTNAASIKTAEVSNTIAVKSPAQTDGTLTPVKAEKALEGPEPARRRSLSAASETAGQTVLTIPSSPRKSSVEIIRTPISSAADQVSVKPPWASQLTSGWLANETSDLDRPETPSKVDPKSAEGDETNDFQNVTPQQEEFEEGGPPTEADAVVNMEGLAKAAEMAGAATSPILNIGGAAARKGMVRRATFNIEEREYTSAMIRGSVRKKTEDWTSNASRTSLGYACAGFEGGPDSELLRALAVRKQRTVCNELVYEA